MSINMDTTNVNHQNNNQINGNPPTPNTPSRFKFPKATTTTEEQNETIFSSLNTQNPFNNYFNLSFSNDDLPSPSLNGRINLQMQNSLNSIKEEPEIGNDHPNTPPCYDTQPIPSPCTKKDLSNLKNDVKNTLRQLKGDLKREIENTTNFEVTSLQNSLVYVTKSESNKVSSKLLTKLNFMEKSLTDKMQHNFNIMTALDTQYKKNFEMQKINIESNHKNTLLMKENENLKIILEQKTEELKLKNKKIIKLSKKLEEIETKEHKKINHLEDKLLKIKKANFQKQQEIASLQNKIKKMKEKF